MESVPPSLTSPGKRCCGRCCRCCSSQRQLFTPRATLPRMIGGVASPRPNRLRAKHPDPPRAAGLPRAARERDFLGAAQDRHARTRDPFDRRVRSTVGVSLRFFGSAVRIGMARAFDRREPWRFTFGVGQGL